MSQRVSKNWLLARLYEADIVIADCRFQLGKPDAGREAYEAGHIPRAVYLDLERDLSGPVEAHGGRHPLPDAQQLIERLRRAGIGRDSRVVAYDDQGGAMASRLWWLLRYLGHEQVYVMEEGYSAWAAAGFPVTTEQPVVIPSDFAGQPRPELLADVEAVRQASQSGAPTLIDSREPRRYAGLEEPIDRKAGHIPGARNFFWKQALDEQNRWLSAEELQAHFAGLEPEQEIVVYCGSGVTACPNVLALTEAGFRNVRLYAGSWSDWISYSENPIATGEE